MNHHEREECMMIYTESMIDHMMGLDASSIEKGFRNAEYFDIKIESSKFVGLNDRGQFVYACKFSEGMKQNIFVTLNEDMKLMCEF